MDKVSDKLAELVVSSDPGTEVNLHVMLQRGLEADRTKAIVDSLTELATDKEDVKVFALSGIITLRGTLRAVKEIAGDPNVVWIDRDSEVPMEELLDQ